MGISVKAETVVKTKVGIRARKELAFAYMALDGTHFKNRVKKMIRDQEQESDAKVRLSDAQLKTAVNDLRNQAKEDAVLINGLSTLILKADPAKILDYQRKDPPDHWMAAMAGIVGDFQARSKERAEKAAQTRAENKKTNQNGI